ncbi:MAG: hypothetical protein ACYDEY_09145 [Acidimicrobiales bacterium]
MLVLVLVLMRWTGMATGGDRTPSSTSGGRRWHAGACFPASIQLTKYEAFSVCEVLADAGGILSRLEMQGEASRLGGVIDLLESRLVHASRPFEEN